MEEVTELFAVLGALGLMVIGLIFKSLMDEQKLVDPSDNSVVGLDELEQIIELIAASKFEVTIWRQSGEIHKSEIWETRDASSVSSVHVLNKVLTTFRRAKIDAVAVIQNTNLQFSFRRLHYSHAGRKEGRKIYRAEIRVVSSPETGSSAK